MSSYAELYQQQAGLPGTDGRPGYTAIYLSQQAESAGRRPSSVERIRILPSATDGATRQQPAVPSPRHYDSHAVVTATATTLAVEADVGRPVNARSPQPMRTGAPGNRSPSLSPPRPRMDPSVSRPATTVLAQATAMRMARLQRLAQRQQQVRQPQPGPPSMPAAAAGGSSRRSGRLLSAVLQQAPHLYDRQRLSAVERFIERVDALPARFTDAQVVYLSKNSLTSVAGLAQFPGLRVLGLADNLLADPDQLEVLAGACPGLEALSLEGNPLAYVPHYRSRVLLALPALKSLDGRPVTEEERAAAPGAVAAEEAVMTVLLRNACEVHKMASVVQRAQVHLELLHALHS
ncbi:hypothetical protein Agub_g15943, partial [Astrephomene gubernaculifera]